MNSPSLNLHQVAKALGGEVSGSSVLCPGPGHSAADRSLSVMLSATAPDGFVVKSFADADDDVNACRDHVRKALGLAPFQPKDKQQKTRQFDFRDPRDGKIRYAKIRHDNADGTKKIYFKPAQRGGSQALLYGGERIAKIRSDAPVWIVEGENKVDRLAELGAVAVSADAGAKSRWLADHAKMLSRRRIILWPDSDEPGENYISNAAAAIRADNPDADIRVVRPFPRASQGEKGRDVCDWRGDVAALAAIAAGAEPFRLDALGDTPAPAFRRIINPAEWEGLPVPEREWIVPERIPHKTVTLLSGDGSAGKSLLTMQLGAARALARDWIGLMPEPGRTLILSAEDDRDEMHRRLDDVRKLHGVRMTDFADMRLIDLVGEDCILGALMKGQILPTPMYHALDAYMGDFKPSLVALDVLADMFSGDENDRPQARQFIGLLKKLAREHDCAFLLLAHPSLTGINSGTGTSGSTGWSNSVRSRLYFQTAKASDGSAPNKNLRTLEVMKSNYGAAGEQIIVEWKSGVFVPVAGESGLDKMAADAKSDDLFLKMLERFEEQGRNVSVNVGPTYAPTCFAAEADVKGVTKKQFADAMSRLLRDGKIRVETTGPASRQRSKIIIAEPSCAASNEPSNDHEIASNDLPTPSNACVCEPPPYPPGALEGAPALEDAGSCQPPGRGNGAVFEVEL
jgi:RecA-family ATPase